MKAYLITMPYPERSRYAAKMAGQLDFPVEIFSASLPEDARRFMSKEDVKGKGLGLTRFRLYAGLTDELKPGEYGCALSHMRVWKRIVEEGNPAIVLEDDAAFIRNADVQLSDIINEIGRSSFFRNSLVYLGAFRNIKPIRMRLNGIEKIELLLLRKIYKSRFTGGPMLNWVYSRLNHILASPRDDQNSKIALSGLHDGTHAYYCSPRAAKILLEINAGLDFPSDTTIKFAVFSGKLVAGIARDLLFTQRQMSSTIDSSRDFRDILQLD